jgi:hypothetical protein
LEVWFFENLMSTERGDWAAAASAAPPNRPKSLEFFRETLASFVPPRGYKILYWVVSYLVPANPLESLGKWDEGTLVHGFRY